MRPIILLPALWLVVAVPLCAQDKTSLDSLEEVYNNTAVSDSTRVIALCEIAKQYYRSNPDTSLMLGGQAMAWAEQIGFERGKARALNVIGLAHWIKSDHKTALKEFQQALEFFESSNDSEGYAVCLNNIGLIYYYQDDFKTALEYYTRSLELQQKIGNANGIALSFNNLGLTHEKQGNLTKALDYYLGALHLYEESNNEFGIAQCQTNIGYIQFSMGKYDEALQSQLRAVRIQEKINDKSTLISSLICIAQVHEQQGHHEQCISVATRAVSLARELHSIYDVRDATKVLYEAYKKRKDYANALLQHEIFASLTDSIYSVESSKAIANLETKATLDNKEKELLASKEQSTLRQYINYGAIGALICLAILSWLVFRNGARLQVAYNNLAVANKTLREVKEEVEVKAGMLDASNRAKDKVFSVLSHDLRSPLNSLKSMFQLLESKAISHEEFVHFIPELSQRVNHSHTIVEELLQWSRSQMGAIEVKPVEFSINEFLNTEVLRSMPDAQSKGVKLTFNTAADDPVAFTDPDMLRTVTRNLISNAVKFCRKGDEINILAKREGPMIHIYVSDTGVGIKQEDLGRVFSGHGFTTEGTAHEKGTGVGLILTKEFIERNGGTISVSSEVGKGATFEFTVRTKA